jgi:predicted nuclease of predicted toxin-antitoxin system
VRFLADEDLHADLVRWLRSRGHDVSYAAETAAGEPDEALLRRAREDGRILVTDDKDFGEPVVRRGFAAMEVLLIRQWNPSLRERVARLADVWNAVEPKLPRAFVVVSDRRVRVRPLGRNAAAGGS